MAVPGDFDFDLLGAGFLDGLIGFNLSAGEKLPL